MLTPVNVAVIQTVFAILQPFRYSQVAVFLHEQTAYARNINGT